MFGELMFKKNGSGLKDTDRLMRIEINLKESIRKIEM